MKRTTMGIIGFSLVAILAILIVIFPVSGVQATGPQNNTGNQYGEQGFQNGTVQAGHHSGFGNGTCLQENCPNNGTPKMDGTGRQFDRSGNGKGGQSRHHGQGSCQQDKA